MCVKKRETQRDVNTDREIVRQRQRDTGNEDGNCLLRTQWGSRLSA